MNIPTDLKHKPIVKVNYKNIDECAGFGDAEYLSLGRSQWNNDEFSAKTWRRLSNGKWSPRSEELQFWRLLDLAALLIIEILQKWDDLPSLIIQNEVDDKPIGIEYEINIQEIEHLRNFISKNKNIYYSRLKLLKKLLENLK